jgi:hypothetical protein
VTTHADAAVLERVLRESGVDQTPPGPTWVGYAQALAEAFARWLERVFPHESFFRHLPEAVGFALIASAIALVVGVLAVAVRAGLRARTQRLASRTGAGPRTVAAPIPRPERDRAEWRDELERRLAQGDVAGALEALWWWFARTVSASKVDPAWTSRELIAQAGRLELAPLAFALDRLLYGAERPHAETIRTFLRQGEEALP